MHNLVYSRPPQQPTHLQYYHVTIDGTGTTSYATPTQYEQAVRRELERIHRSRTGRAVFHEFMIRTKHLMKIIPYDATPVNADATPADPRRATPRGIAERDGRDGHVLLDSRGRRIIALGGGSDSQVRFTPMMLSNFCNQQQPGHKSGCQPDEALFHEMIHATRQMRGFFNPVPLGFFYDTEEEFFAILLANIYASETGRPLDLRSDHRTFDHLSTDVNATFLPRKDMTDYRYRLVDKLVRQEPRMVQELKRLTNTAFNPIRRYFELQRTSVNVHP